MQTAQRAAATEPQAKWTAALVRDRLAEAFEVEARLPEPRRPGRGVRSAWPTMTREFSDLVSWSDAAREAVWADWARAKGAHAYEVSRMEEALTWLELIRSRQEEFECLKAWATAQSRKTSLRRFLRRMGLPRSRFYRRVNEGAVRIAAALNADGVRVR